MSSVWIEVFAGLKNPAMRQVLGTVLVGRTEELGLDKATTKNLERWAKVGLLVATESGWQLNEQLLTDALKTQAKPVNDREGTQRFFTGLKLDTLPAKPGERFAVLEHIRDAVLRPDERLREEQLNERLKVVNPDAAMLRRAMVDGNLLERSPDGSRYSFPDKVKKELA